MAERSTWDVEAREAFRDAREPRPLATAVVRFHRRVDEVVEQTIRGHSVNVACTRGCSYCCSLRVEATPHETFVLAEWLRRHFAPERLAAVTKKLAANVGSHARHGRGGASPLQSRVRAAGR